LSDPFQLPYINFINIPACFLFHFDQVIDGNNGQYLITAAHPQKIFLCFGNSSNKNILDLLFLKFPQDFFTR